MEKTKYYIVRITEKKVGPYSSLYMNIPKELVMRLSLKKGDIVKITVIEEEGKRSFKCEKLELS